MTGKLIKPRRVACHGSTLLVWCKVNYFTNIIENLITVRGSTGSTTYPFIICFRSKIIFHCDIILVHFMESRELRLNYKKNHKKYSGVILVNKMVHRSNIAGNYTNATITTSRYLWCTNLLVLYVLF